jgi:hypothetical protein
MSESIRIDCCSATADFSKLRHLFRKSWSSLDLLRANFNINIKIWKHKIEKKESQAEGAQHLNYRIKNHKKAINISWDYPFKEHKQIFGL